MSQSAIYIVNNTTQTVADGGSINLGTVIRRFGPNVALSGNSVQLAGAGYYDLDSYITIVPSTAGDVTVTAYKDGVIIPGAVSTETAAAADDYVNLSIGAIIREGCPCCDPLSSITFVLSGVESDIENIATKVIKL